MVTLAACASAAGGTMWLPQLWWRRPSSKDEASFLDKCSGLNYDEKYSGATSEAPLDGDRVQQLRRDGFSINHKRVKLGSGMQAFCRGKEKLQNWGHLQLGWVGVDPATHIRPGNKFGLHVHELVTWLINPLQILYVTDTSTNDMIETIAYNQTDGTLSLNRPKSAEFAFGSGTLKGHLLAGEERFAVEWNSEDDSVWYEVLSFSKPAHFLSVAGLPIVKFQQEQFAKHSSEVMLRDAERCGDAERTA